MEFPRQIHHPDFAGLPVKSDGQPKSVRRRLLRILFTDADATDSSSGEEDAAPLSRPRVKRHAHEIMFEIAPRVRRPPLAERRGKSRDLKGFRGVRRRPWGRWAAEIRDPASKEKNAVTNFPTAKGQSQAAAGSTEKTVAGELSPSFASPTSVLRYGGDQSLFDCLNYGEVDAFGLGVEPPLCSSELSLPNRQCWEFEFGDFNAEDFVGSRAVDATPLDKGWRMSPPPGAATITPVRGGRRCTRLGRSTDHP
ncbi:hypothetical protein KSP40_PGU022123 [Platanthera guangdongensis]|uniref:AP2/ERF domain-containing protein n=1 Tax=Platanthera guangdongensis TaxID=2320717 RepID=A0ABR2MHG1_9ASPA